MLQGPWPPGRPRPAGSCLHPVPTTSSHVASRKNRQMPSLSLLEGPHVLLGLVPWVLSERGCCCIGLWLTNSEPPPPLARGRRCRQPSAKKNTCLQNHTIYNIPAWSSNTEGSYLRSPNCHPVRGGSSFSTSGWYHKDWAPSRPSMCHPEKWPPPCHLRRVPLGVTHLCFFFPGKTENTSRKVQLQVQGLGFVWQETACLKQQGGSSPPRRHSPS